MATITRKEVERLQRRDFAAEIWEQEANRFRGEFVKETQRNWENFLKIEELKSKLWDTEKEVHDLKYELERLNDTFARVDQIQDEIIVKLEAELENTKARLELVEATNRAGFLIYNVV
jgi:hypothetical protein